MNKFDVLTSYIPMIQVDRIGEWIIDKENDGTPEHPMQMPFVDYSEIVSSFIKDVYAFQERNKDVGLNNYLDVLKDNNLQWDMESMKNAEVSNLDEQCVLALIMGAIRAERFCDGALFDFFESGFILEWLERLKVLSKEGE